MAAPEPDPLRAQHSLKRTFLEPAEFAELVNAIGSMYDGAIERGVPLSDAQRGVLKVLDRRHAGPDYYRAVALANFQTRRRIAAAESPRSQPAHHNATVPTPVTGSPTEPQQQRKQS